MVYITHLDFWKVYCSTFWPDHLMVKYSPLFHKAKIIVQGETVLQNKISKQEGARRSGICVFQKSDFCNVGNHIEISCELAISFVAKKIGF